MISEEGSCDAEVPSRLQAATKAYHGLRTKFFNIKEVPRRTKVRIYISVILPVLKRIWV